MDRDRLGLLLACLALAACPSSNGGGGNGETDTDGEDTTGGPGGNTLPVTMTSTGSSTTTTDPATTDMTMSTSASDSMSSSSTGEPGGSGCCEPHGGPGCNEPDVQTCVCKTLPECCVFEWDQPCVDAAMMDCDATCMAVDTGDTGTADCELQQIELGAVADASLSGGWMAVNSTIKGGQEVAAISMGDTSGSVLFTVPIPCMDTWYVWVRFLDAGGADSYFVTLDAEPDPPAIFEGDCTQEPFGTPEYGWRLLNWRDNSDPMNPGNPCEYLEDPWTADWDMGDHTVEFTFREAYALSRILVTNDPDFVPE
jgi:hypothetical protein